MKSLVSGVLMLSFVLIYILSGAELAVFLNLHAIILVIVGTIGVFALSTPPDSVKAVITSFRHLASHERSSQRCNDQLLQLNQRKDARVGEPAHEMIGYAQELWEKGVDNDVFRTMLYRRLTELNGASARSIAAMRNLAKYPPALGMTGTVIGLISLFSHLTPDNRTALGPSLALAMTATFYGLITANLLVMPIADRLHVVHLRSVELNQHVHKILLMIHEDQGESIVRDEIHAA